MTVQRVTPMRGYEGSVGEAAQALVLRLQYAAKTNAPPPTGEPCHLDGRPVYCIAATTQVGERTVLRRGFLMKPQQDSAGPRELLLVELLASIDQRSALDRAERLLRDTWRWRS